MTEALTVGFQRRAQRSEVDPDETRYWWVVYIRYSDGLNCTHTGQPVLTRMPSYFFDSHQELGPSDCITMIGPADA